MYGHPSPYWEATHNGLEWDLTHQSIYIYICSCGYVQTGYTHSYVMVVWIVKMMVKDIGFRYFQINPHQRWMFHWHICREYMYTVCFFIYFEYLWMMQLQAQGPFYFPLNIHQFRERRWKMRIVSSFHGDRVSGFSIAIWMFPTG